MQQSVHVVFEIVEEQAADLSSQVRVNLSVIGDVRPDGYPKWNPGEPQTGPSYISGKVLPGSAELLNQDFINKLGADIRDALETRMKRALVF